MTNAKEFLKCLILGLFFIPTVIYMDFKNHIFTKRSHGNNI